MNIQQQLNIQKDFIEIGQSLWLDNIRRDILLNNTLSGLIENYFVSGLTSNPTIFEEAIKDSKYDESLKILSKKCNSIEDIAYTLMIEDIQRACDIFSEIYIKTKGNDGYVSIEIPPTVESKSEIIKWAKDIFSKIGRPNAMIKIQATKDGISAMEDLIKQGINVNMTLIFSPKVYEEVASSYIRAIKWRYEKKMDPDVFSVASFFVSRIDTAIDKELEEIANKEVNPNSREKILSLKGKSAISNSLIAYSKYLELFYSDSFSELIKNGFKPQKILWASTSTKNPSYPDTLYLNELCLKHSIATVPQQTLYAFFEHGNINKKPLFDRIIMAKTAIDEIKDLGINYEKILSDLLIDGLNKFKKSYENILKTIKEKILSLGCEEETIMQIYNSDLNNEITKMNKDNFVKRLFDKDPSLWKKDKEHANIIKNSLGWLRLPEGLDNMIEDIEEFTREIISEKKYENIVLLGMGGSSLAPEVLRSLFQKNNFPKLYILDSTNPDLIRAVEKQINIKKTLFIFSSKSGGTVEPNSQYKYFYSKLKKLMKNPGDNFIAITDKGTSLHILAQKKKFKRIFLNPSDIGGRFSALSYFGMLPAALCGCDIKKLILQSKILMDEIIKTDKNSATILGCFMAKNYSLGKDKLTIILPKKLERFGLWIEQLIAESTGKEGKGIIPVIETDVLDSDDYETDRMFVSLQFKNFINKDLEYKVDNLISSKLPVIKIYLDDLYDIGKEFYRWEIATALCGYFMGINPFDQPDVVTTKEITRKLLESKKDIKLKPQYILKNSEIYIANFKAQNEIKKYDDIFWEIFNIREDKGYYSICAYFPETEKMDNLLKKISFIITRTTTSPCIKSYGPRYLHSTGQLFKGGNNKGIFIILTNLAKKDIKIVGEDYTFHKLCLSQAQGDFLALKEKGRKVIMIHIKVKDIEREMRVIAKKLEEFSSNESDKEGKMAKTALKRKNATTTTENGYVVIDYPKHMETITSRHYTIRIGTSDAKGVEVSIDNGPWHATRHSVGYWWYDWNDIKPGNHEIIAKMHKHDGSFLISKRRRCKVV
ncbi:MAG: bifunctional transaldolase/phosoglucose isomerase [Elusimicrobiota bacterium]